MKKILIATLIGLAATSASALEFGVSTTRDYSGDNRNGFGIFVGDRSGRGAVQFGVEQFTRGTNDQNRFSVMGSYDVTKFGPVTVSGKGGVAFLDNQTSQDGAAAVVGVGASLPISKALSLNLDVSRQYGQKRVEQFDGTLVSTSLKVSF